MTQAENRRNKILEFIKSFINEKKYPPTIRDIGDHMKIKSTSLIDFYLNGLEDSGLINRDRNISRGITVPVVGAIRSGEVVPSEELAAFEKRVREPAQTNSLGETVAEEIEERRRLD
jgi:repressor LexA